MSEPRTLWIGDVEYFEYFDSDLRFTGWEHECIIVDRTENHYWVPKHRYEELMAPPKERPKEKWKPEYGRSGVAGCTGTSEDNKITNTYNYDTTGDIYDVSPDT